MLDAALQYAAHGWFVFPLRPMGKTPLTPHGFKDATTEEAQIRAWWTEHPDANIGVATGARSAITVLDVDVKEWKGKHGDQALASLIAKHGMLPVTLMQRTWSGGWQLVFKYEPSVPNTVEKIGHGLDTRGDGGYIVVAPSHVVEEEREGQYTWGSDPRTTALASMPEWLLAQANNGHCAAKAPRPTSEWAEVLKGVEVGRRQEELARIVGLLYRKHAPEVARPLAHGWAKQCSQENGPLTEQDVNACCDRIEHRESMKLQPLDKDDPGRERFTDMANAGRLAEKAAGKAGHVHEMKDYWHIFDGLRLVLRPKTSMIPFVKAVAQDLFMEAELLEKEAERLSSVQDGNMTADALSARAASVEQLEKRALELRCGAQRLESKTGCFAAIDLAQAEPPLMLQFKELDAHPTWLNTPTATVDLAGGHAWPHRFEDQLTKVTKARYDPAARCPRWEKFLEDVLPDPEVRAFMQRSVGYALTDFMQEQCLWFLYGTGRNGKTTFVNAVRAVLGDYAASTRASTLMVKPHGDDRRNDLAVLRGARFVSATEAEDGQLVAEGLIKEMTGQDPVTARLLYAEFFTFTPTFKIWLAANHKPVVRGTDLGIWRRIHLVPFEVTLPEGSVDKQLPQSLEAEASGILNWSIAGFKEWQLAGLRPPKAVLAATAAYRTEMDTLADFLAEYVVPDSLGECTAAELYSTYVRWCQASGLRSVSHKKLGLQLAERGYMPYTAGDGSRRWRGLRLRRA
jgi:putative DNA primase/helicase